MSSNCSSLSFLLGKLCFSFLSARKEGGGDIVFSAEGSCRNTNLDHLILPTTLYDQIKCVTLFGFEVTTFPLSTTHDEKGVFLIVLAMCSCVSASAASQGLLLGRGPGRPRSRVSPCVFILTLTAERGASRRGGAAAVTPRGPKSRKRCPAHVQEPQM